MIRTHKTISHREIVSASARQLRSLRDGFSTSVDDLKRRRADLVPPSTIEAYVDLDWLSWQGGCLKLTTVGENIYAQLRNERIASMAS